MEEKSAVSFAKDILPLFRSMDIDHMSPMGVLLDDYSYMSDPANAKSVYEYLSGAQEPQMPPGGPYWSADQLALFERWMSGGCKP